jgi:hypothetical protein
VKTTRWEKRSFALGWFRLGLFFVAAGLCRPAFCFVAARRRGFKKPYHNWFDGEAGFEIAVIDTAMAGSVRVALLELLRLHLVTERHRRVDLRVSFFLPSALLAI